MESGRFIKSAGRITYRFPPAICFLAPGPARAVQCSLMNPPTPRRILAIKLADLGDVLNITPALAALRHSFPQARLDVLVNPHTASLLHGSTLVDEVVVFPKTNFEGVGAFRPAAWLPLGRYMRDLRRRRYDAVLDFHHLTTPLGRVKQRALVAATGSSVTVGLDNGHGGWLSHPVRDQGFGARREVEYWLALAERLGADNPGYALDLPVSERDKFAAETLLSDLNLSSRPFAVLHPGSGGFSLARRWDAPKFAALAAALLDRYALPSLLVGTPDDGAEAVLAAAESPIIDLSGRTNLKELAALLAGASLFVGADSGVMHMAAAMKTPLVALFGPSNDRAWAPWTPKSRSRVVRLGISCSPCAYVKHSVGWRHGCPERTCMADLGVAQVMAAVDEILALE